MTRREAPISPPVVLTVAGSDSGGGAGIQADLKAIEACGGFGTSAITSVTAQNTRGVQGSHRLPIDDIDAQIRAVREDFDVAAVKTGMLATGDVIDLVVDHATDVPRLVVDPVMVAASGDRLLAEAAETAYERLVAEATLVTPNADEAEVLTGVAVDDREAAARAGRILVDDQGADAALVKGGHVAGDHVVDTLVVATDTDAIADTPGDATTDAADDVDGNEPQVTTFRHDRIETDATHGSGCTLSSAIATHLAHGDDLETAVGRGIDLLVRAVRYNADVGQGVGAVHHLVDLRNDASRAATQDLVHHLADRVREAGWTNLVPPSGLGFAASTPHAEAPGDVAAVAGRLDGEDLADAGRGEDRPTTEVRFDVDDPLASLVLAAREAAPSTRFGALVGTDRDALDGLGGDVLTVDTDDPAAGTTDLAPDARLPAEVLAPIEGAADPVAVVLGPAAAGDDDGVTAATFGDTATELVDRLRRTAAP